MAMLILLVLLIFFAALGIPLAFAIGASCVTYILIYAPTFITMLPQRVWNGAYSELMIAMPLFMLAGELMNTGGITQRIGAYQGTVNLAGEPRKITFLDTPGHEAFTAMRARGAELTDVAILVVAADDGVMPQTVEAINHAQAAHVPIVVAVNKIDKPGANPDKVRGQLTEYGLVPEEYGGNTMFVDISAKQGTNVDKLLEAVLLTADAELDLRANPDMDARGATVEARLDKGRGAVATVLVQSGTLHIGDAIVAGTSYGRVRAMLDENGNHMQEAGPSTPVQVLGLTSVPTAGDLFLVASDDRTARQIAEKRQATERAAQLAKRRKVVSLESLKEQFAKSEVDMLNIVIKGDSSGSVEALEDSLMKIEVSDEVGIQVIHRGVGAITQNDVNLATVDKAVIIGFNVRPNRQVADLAEREGVEIKYYSIIYKAIEDIEASLKGMLKPEYEEVVTSHSEIREIFRSSKFGNIAGVMVQDGEVKRGVNVKFVKKYVDFDYKVVKAEGKSPARIVLKYASGEKNQMTVKSNIEMRTKADYQNLIVTTLKKNTKVTVLEESGDWTKVGTDDGFMGYVPAKKLKDKETKKTDFKSDTDTYTHVLMDKKISLGWNAITNLTANGNLETIIEHTKGLNVISPTWYSLSDNKGNLRSYASATYVEKAHSKGLKVWALVNDFGTQDKASKEYTKKVLTDTTKRENLVDNIMTNIKDYNLDGINIDFEFINKDIINSYLQFLRELSIECRKAGKVLSIDNYVPSSGSEYYDIAHQSLVADYIIIMSYDEHYAGSKEAGSVSSMTFTEKAVSDAIALTGDASRVINGMPFYTRAWITTPATDGKKGEGVYVEDATNGNYYLSSQAITMDKAKELYTNEKVKPTFDETTGQNFVSYEKGDSTVSIWLEDATSVKSRLDIMEKYKLAGAAYWRLGQETDSIWDTIYPYFK